jgi:hypothetical protein
VGQRFCVGLWAIHRGGLPGKYVFPGNPGASTAVKQTVYGTAPPASGTWKIGDLAYNTAPASGGVVGWVFTSSGWRGFGTIA